MLSKRGHAVHSNLGAHKLWRFSQMIAFTTSFHYYFDLFDIM